MEFIFGLRRSLDLNPDPSILDLEYLKDQCISDPKIQINEDCIHILQIYVLIAYIAWEILIFEDLLIFTHLSDNSTIYIFKNLFWSPLF